MGGSSSGGSYNRLGDMRALEEKAKRVLQEGRKNVFISFAYEDINEVNLLRGQAKNQKSDIEFNDYSVKEPFDSKRADYIREQLTERIKRASTTVVFLSANTASSKWVQWEVDKSIELGKTVVAVHAGKVRPTLPGWVSDHKVEVVPWSQLSSRLGTA